MCVYVVWVCRCAHARTLGACVCPCDCLACICVQVYMLWLCWIMFWCADIPAPVNVYYIRRDSGVPTAIQIYCDFLLGGGFED